MVAKKCKNCTFCHKLKVYKREIKVTPIAEDHQKITTVSDYNSYVKTLGCNVLGNDVIQEVRPNGSCLEFVPQGNN